VAVLEEVGFTRDELQELHQTGAIFDAASKTKAAAE
jgi:hypothetical protein